MPNRSRHGISPFVPPQETCPPSRSSKFQAVARAAVTLDRGPPHVRGASIDPPGYDAGKKIKGKKRHILVDTQGLLMHAIVHAAKVQDRDGGVWLLATLFARYPFLMKLYADAGYQGPQFQ